MDENLIFVTARESGERIDALLAVELEDYSRNAAQRLLEDGCVLLNGKILKKNYRCNTGDVFEVHLPDITEIAIEAQDIPLDVVFEDNDIIVINKPRGMVVHPAPGHPDGTLVNALMFHCGDSLSGIGGEIRPGIVHRIDKDTSGLLICAKNDFAHRALSLQLSDHSLYREYIAVVNGRMREIEGTVDAPIARHSVDRKKMAVQPKDGKSAVTHWKRITNYKEYSLVECILETGRTHQIRVHMAYIGHPLVGDGIYGAKSPDKGLEGQCLHARKLHFIHPVTKEKMELEAPLPEYFNNTLLKLGPELED